MSFLRHEDRPMSSMPGWPDRTAPGLIGSMSQPEHIVKRAEVEVQSKTSEWQVVS